MSRQPRSKRVVNLLNALESIYSNPDASIAERLEAAALSAKLLSKKKPAKRQVKSRNVKNALEQIRQLQNGGNK